MNILPHKSWHVRTKANIAKVRRDEAKAAEEEKEKQRRIDLAEQEARIQILRKKSKCERKPEIDLSQTESQPIEDDELTKRLRNGEHINFFSDLESGNVSVAKPNPEYVNAKKDEQEKYEKQVGYLTYLGQDTNEALGKRDWYEMLPKRPDAFDKRGPIIEVGLKTKSNNDPLNIMKKCLAISEKSKEAASKTSTYIHQKPIEVEPINGFVSSCKRKQSRSPSISSIDDRQQLKKSKKEKRKKEKKRKKSKYKTSDKHRNHHYRRKYDYDEKQQNADKEFQLKKLREERHRREQVEKAKAENLLKRLQGDASVMVSVTKEKSIPRQLEPKAQPIKQKYNSQFNPELAKQNYEDYKRF